MRTTKAPSNAVSPRQAVAEIVLVLYSAERSPLSGLSREFTLALIAIDILRVNSATLENHRGSPLHLTKIAAQLPLGNHSWHIVFYVTLTEMKKSSSATQLTHDDRLGGGPHLGDSIGVVHGPQGKIEKPRSYSSLASATVMHRRERNVGLLCCSKLVLLHDDPSHLTSVYIVIPLLYLSLHSSRSATDTLNYSSSISCQPFVYGNAVYKALYKSSACNSLSPFSPSRLLPTSDKLSSRLVPLLVSQMLCLPQQPVAKLIWSANALPPTRLPFNLLLHRVSSLLADPKLPMS